MSNKSRLLILETQTSLHAGAGQSVAGIDLPIQREIHTQWPCIYGSSVKGALRAHAEKVLNKADPIIIDLFGPAHSNKSDTNIHDHAGALMLSDARLLLLPIRSLQSCFKWVTCPAILERLAKDAKRMSIQFQELNFDCITDNEAISSDNSSEHLFLEEFCLTIKKDEEISTLCRNLSDLMDNTNEQQLKDRLVIVNNDVFSFLAKNSTAINTHIAIDSDKKFVKEGALWTEETLPPETILYITVAAAPSRRAGSDLKTAELVIDKFITTYFPSDNLYIQLGGNETTGMGWCHVSINPKNKEG